MRTLSNENPRQSWPQVQLIINILALCLMFVVNLSSTSRFALELTGWDRVQLQPDVPWQSWDACLSAIGRSARHLGLKTEGACDQGVINSVFMMKWTNTRGFMNHENTRVYVYKPHSRIDQNRRRPILWWASTRYETVTRCDRPWPKPDWVARQNC